MLKIQFLVLGKSWTLRLLARKKYVRKNGTNAAVTAGWKRIIDLGPRGYDLETIRHELVHAYLTEMGYDCVDNLTAAQMEELCCELFARRGQEILDLADELLEKMANPPSQ